VSAPPAHLKQFTTPPRPAGRPVVQRAPLPWWGRRPEARGRTALVGAGLAAGAAGLALAVAPGAPELGVGAALLAAGAGVLLGPGAGALTGALLLPVHALLSPALGLSGLLPGAGGAEGLALLGRGAVAAGGLAALGAGVGRLRARLLREDAHAAAQESLAARLRESEERYALAARGANDGLWDWEPGSGTLHLSERARVLLGWEGAAPATQQARAGLLERVHPEDRARVEAGMRAHVSGESPRFCEEMRVCQPGGGWLWLLASAVAVGAEGAGGGGSYVRLAGSLTDISEQKRTEERLRRQALHDDLTGLPNRALLVERLEQVLARSRRTLQPYAVLFLDLDRFKLVNDSLGHAAGDALLREVARRLRAQLRTEDTVARLGGDEFAILLEDVRGEEDALTTGRRLERALREVASVEGQEVVATASIGVVLGGPGDGARAEDLLRDADAAMYRAKALGRSCVQLFTDSLRASALEALQLDGALRRGIERGEFRAHYQPIVCLRTGRVVALEALARWHHPERGLLAPATFIPAAEETGLIVPLSERVMEEACRHALAWQSLRPADAPLQVSVNLSGRQVSQGGVVEAVRGALQRSGLPAHLLRLEVTESVVMGDVEQAGQVLTELRALGVSLGMDDFGTGYSSLGALHQFPFQTLKLDRSFVWRLQHSERSREVVRTMVNLAHTLGLNVVAEGVEKPEQLEALRAMGCEEVQGYLFARPLDPAATEALLRADPHW
jgi:diguanylate cyclase (GGDEF)-like protein